ncbi:MAG: putative sensor domain DACNV-containing protein [Candidatus Sulfotelmatobacter sp.]
MASYPADLAVLIQDRLKREKVPAPSADVLTKFLEVIYFVSLKTEESEYVRCWVTFADPRKPDADPPARARADRWSIAKLENRIPFNTRNLVKFAPAADPWSTAVAVYYDKGALFIWGLVDQAVHTSTALVRESSSRYPPPGIFYAIAQGTADLSVYREDGLIARLRQDTIVTREHNVLWRGPIYRMLLPSIRKLRAYVVGEVGRETYDASQFSPGGLEEEWLGTLSRLLIGIQRYRHGGALLLSNTVSDLHFKYPLHYDRLCDCLRRRAVFQVRASAAMHEIHDRYIEYDKKRLPMGLYYEEGIARGEEEDCDAELTGCVRFISSLSRVDGLIHCDSDLRINGFGAEILVGDDPKRVFQSSASKPSAKDLLPLDPSHFGMRHRSMMRFCARHVGSVGFVISQDGDIRAMVSDARKLYVWENVMVLHLWKEYMSRMSRRFEKKYGKSFGAKRG